MPLTTIFIRTYWRDAPWLTECLKSIKKHCTGFAGVVVHCDESDVATIHPIVMAAGIGRLVHSDPWCRKGYINQQIVKLHADTWIHEGNITFVDSDVIFYAPTTPETFTVDGKIRVLHTPWEKVGDAQSWRAPTRDIVGVEPPFEFMRRLPLTYRVDTLQAFRKLIARHPGGTAAERLAGLSKLSEFNALGTFAFTYQHELYCWQDTESVPLPPLTCKQYWSWGGINGKIRMELDAGQSDLSPQASDTYPFNTVDPETAKRGLEVASLPDGAVLFNGIAILKEDSHISRWVEDHGRLDIQENQLLPWLGNVRPGDTVLDVGAFIGIPP
jgi:hypothetical protein